MIYFKELDIDGHEEITKRLRKYVAIPTSYDLTHIARRFSRDEFLKTCPDLVQQVDDMMQDELDFARTFITRPQDSQPIHVDGHPDENHLRYLGLNWPLYYCEGSYMHWYDAVSNAKRDDGSRSDYGDYQMYYPEDCALVSSLELVKPTLVRINVPHNVENLKPTPRVVISLRFKNDLRHIKI
jgi:hypothetical protein